MRRRTRYYHVLAGGALGMSGAVQSFTTSFTGLNQCQPLPLTWSGAPAGLPFTFMLLPINATISNRVVAEIPDTIETWNATTQTGSYTLPVFPVPAGAQILATMGGSGTTAVVSLPLTIGDSQQADCLDSTAYSTSAAKLFITAAPPNQCQPFSISWDDTSSLIQDNQVFVRGYLPGGTAFSLGKPIAGARSLEWTPDIAHGTQFILLFSTGGPDGVNTLLETSPLFTVQGNDQSDKACLSQNSPSSTSSIPTTASTTPIPSTAASSSSNNMVPLITGAVVGSLAFIVLCIILTYLFHRRRKLGTDQRQAHIYHTSSRAAWMTTTRPRPVALASHDGLTPPATPMPPPPPRNGERRRPPRPGPSRRIPGGTGQGHSQEPIPTPDLDFGAFSAIESSHQNLDASTPGAGPSRPSPMVQIPPETSSRTSERRPPRTHLKPPS